MHQQAHCLGSVFRWLGIAAFTLILLSSLQAADIDFRPLNLQQALDAAKTEGKLVFLDGVTVTCPPCRRMEKQTFTDPAVANFFNARFVNVRIDLSRDAEGPEVQNRYGLHDFPSLLFLDAAGELVHIHVGFMDAAQFLAFGKDVVAPDFLSLAKLKQAYIAHPNDRHTAAQFIIRHGEAGQDISAAWPSFRRGMLGAALLEQDNWEVFRARIDKLTDAESAYFVQHVQDFQKRYGAEAVTAKYIALHQRALHKAISAADSAAYFSTRASLLRLGNPESQRETTMQDLEWHLAMGNWAQYFKILEDVLSNPKEVELTFLERAASTIGSGDNDPNRLSKALEWSKIACEREPNADHLYTQFTLLDRLNKREEALRIGHQALQATKQAGEPYGDLEDRLKELEGQ